MAALLRASRCRRSATCLGLGLGLGLGVGAAVGVGAGAGAGAGVGFVPPQRHQLRTRVEACRESAMSHPAHRRPQLGLVGTARRRIVTLQDLVRVRVRVRVRDRVRA